jgi:4-amino-4-deoxy-L-arabinose transferase-like glycosyltransferase
MEKITIGIRKISFSMVCLLLVLLIATFLRLYRISDYMTFLGDEGRDALVWLRMIKNGKFTLIGPQTSIGNMYLGPLFYYLMLPFYLLLGTVGPSIGTALFGGATTFLLWVTGKKWFSERAGLLAAFFYAISPVAIIYSRSSWNPNIMPFFALLTVWGIWQFWQKNDFRWLVIIGGTLSMVAQSHYLGLLLIPVTGIFWLMKLVELHQSNSSKTGNFFVFSGVALSLFILLAVLPLVWFDLRHSFINCQAFYKFFSERQTTVNLKVYKAIPNLWPLWQMLVSRLVAGKNETAGAILAVIFGGTILIAVFYKKTVLLKQKAWWLILVWLVLGLGGMGLYKQHIYDHYFGFLFPAIFLIAGWVVSQPADFKKGGQYFSGALFLAITVLSLIEIPLKYPPNYQMNRVQQVDLKIVTEAQNKPFNFALIAKQNYEAGYEYFLEKWGKKPSPIDPQRFDETVTDQLFVVCEDPVCEPINHPKSQIANFGWAKIINTWDFPWGVKLFKLVHAEKR